MNKQESGYRWLVFASVIFTYFLVVSQRTAPGLITEQLMKDFSISGAAVGLMSSIQFLAYAGFQIPVGILADRYGPYRYLILGTLLSGLGTIIYSQSPNEYFLIISRMFVGMGDATIFVNFVLILNQWFKGNEFIKLLGMVSLAAGLGSLVATVPFSLWISFSGWRIPFLSFGVALVFVSFLLYYVLVYKPKRMFPNEVSSKLPEKRESIWKVLHRMVCTRQAWATFLCHFGMVGTYVGFIGSWAVPYGIHVLGMTRSGASTLVMYGLIGAMIGGPLIGTITSRLASIKKVYIPIYIVVVLSWIGFVLSGITPSFIVVVALLFLTGFGNGAAGSLTFAAVRKSFPAKEVGVVTGFANMGGFLSAVLLPTIFGHVLDMFPAHSIKLGYHYGFIVPVLFSILGLIGAIILKDKKE